jgi:hypothetical protein
LAQVQADMNAASTVPEPSGVCVVLLALGTLVRRIRRT